MASKTVQYGKDWPLKITGGTVTIDNLRTTGITQGVDKRDTTTADSANDHEFVPTIRTRVLPFDGLTTEQSGNGNKQALQNLYDNASVISWQYGPTVNGTYKWSGSGFMTKLDFKAPYNDDVTFDGEIGVTGPVTFAAN